MKRNTIFFLLRSTFLSALPLLSALSPEAADAQEVIKPLVKVHWHQVWPYNAMCPRPAGASSRPLTGCAAVAMAQTLQTIKYAHGSGSKTYAGITFDYSKPLDWNLLPNSSKDGYSQEEWDEIARLMLGCGVSVEMDWGLTSSRAHDFTIPQALVDWYGYDADHTVFVEKNLFSDADWTEFLLSELRAGRPVIYAGNDHIFVLDGSDGKGNWHINWGWGTRSDGYYPLTDLRPGETGPGVTSENFTGNQRAVRVVPPGAKGVMDISTIVGHISYDSSRERLLPTLQPRGIHATPVVTVYPWLIVENMVSGNMVAEVSLPALEIRRYLHALTPQVFLSQHLTNLPEGNYRIYPAFSLTQEVAPQKCYPKPDGQECVWLQVAPSGARTFSNTPLTPPVTSIETPDFTPESSDTSRFFTLSGREVTPPLAPGIYLRRIGSKTSKVVIR